MIIRDPIGKGKTVLDENLGLKDRVELVEKLTSRWEKILLSQPQIWEQESVKTYFDILVSYLLKADVHKEDKEEDGELNG